MHKQIQFLARMINEIDSDPVKSLQFYTGPLDTQSPHVKSLTDVKWNLISTALHQAEHFVQQSDDCMHVDPNVDTILQTLNTHYQQKQHLCWPSHIHHFHTSFQSYVNCPITCLCEIEEYLQKLMKEVFQQ